MRATFVHPRHINLQGKQPVQRETSLSATRLDLKAWLAGGLGFCCLMPYLAVAAGNNTAVQFGAMLAMLICLMVLATKGSSRSLLMFMLLIVPLCTSTTWVAISGQAALDVSMKNMIVYTMSLSAIVAAQFLAPGYGLAMLTGAAIAAVIHFVVGMWQMVVFPSGEFPLLWLYSNPSFLSVQENAETIARWQRRPFGIFPEPSAMSSSLAPFLLLWSAELLGLVRYTATPARWQRLLFAAGAIGGGGLIIVSQSGHAAITLFVLGMFVIAWFVRARATPATLAAIVGLFVVVMPLVLWMAVNSLSKRVGGRSMGNSSWSDRSDSLVIGLKLWLVDDLPTIIFGLGLGGTSTILQRDYGFEAIWSVLLTYIYETGLFGLAAVIAVTCLLLRVWRSTGFDLVMAGIAFVWLVGITITTSYTVLLSPWVTLGLLASWAAVCVKVPARSLRPVIAADRTPLNGEKQSFPWRQRWAAE